MSEMKDLMFGMRVVTESEAEYEVRLLIAAVLEKEWTEESENSIYALLPRDTIITRDMILECRDKVNNESVENY